MHLKWSNRTFLMIMVFFLTACGGVNSTNGKIESTNSFKVVYSDAEDNGTQGWRVGDDTPSGASIVNIYDPSKGDRVIKLDGDGVNNSYLLGGYEGDSDAWNNQQEHVLQWSMKYDEVYSIFVRIMTENGARFILYEAKDNYERKVEGSYILLGLGSDSINGTWKSFSRDLDLDFKRLEPNNAIIAVNGFFIRGSGLIDDIKLVDKNSIDGWQVADDTPPQATVERVYDSSLAKDVIKLTGDGVKNSYMIGGFENQEEAWNNKDEHLLEWSMNYSEIYTIFVRIMTENGARFILYEAKDNHEKKVVGSFILIGLGKDSKDGTWHSFKRDLDADFKRLEPNNPILAVNGFLIRGSGLIDDVHLVNKREIYSNGENNNSIDGWQVEDSTPCGANVQNIYDADKESRVIQLEGNGIDNAYILGAWEGNSASWNNRYQRKLHWSMNFDESYIIYVRIMTKNGPRLMLYEAKDNYERKVVGGYIVIGLGSDSINGTWQNFTRDLDADFKRLEPDNAIVAVNAFLVRGSGLIDDVELRLEIEEDQATLLAEQRLKEIQKLVDDSTLGNEQDVVYITIGDSTRDSYHSAQYYWYKKRLEDFNIGYYHGAQSGMRAEDWANNAFDSSNGQSLNKAVAQARGSEGNRTLVEYSLGINDSNKPYSTPEEWKEHIKFGITEFQRLKPKALIFLVVPTTTLASEKSLELAKIYGEIARELQLPLFNQKRVLKEKMENPKQRVKFYYDNTHPNYFGAIRLLDYIVYNITGYESKKVIQWNPHLFADTSAQTGNLAENKAVLPALWHTTLGISIANEAFRSIEEINVTGNTLLKVQHNGNAFTTLVKDANGSIIGRFDIGNKRSADTLNDLTLFDYRYLYLPKEAKTIGININIIAEYVPTNPVVEYLIDDLASNISQLEEIHKGLDIENVGIYSVP